MTEENKKSKNSDDVSLQEKKNNILWDIIKAIMKNTWGMRISLGMLGFLLFIIGYFMGNWGTSHLESEIKNRESDVVQCKREKNQLKDQLQKTENEKTKLHMKLSESKEKINFIQQREKIRKPLSQALISWKNKKSKDTVEKIYASLINLKQESKNSMGLSKFFYKTTISRLNRAIVLINNGCTDTEKKLNSDDETSKKNENSENNLKEVECHNRIAEILSSALDVLPPPKD
ncbi:MAG: hypothetical protein JXR95_05540 [Deltaproteobacteria bacterium]|nr:hypothetical protein [Deltaproteobacteria bacterium]